MLASPLDPLEDGDDEGDSNREEEQVAAHGWCARCCALQQQRPWWCSWDMLAVCVLFMLAVGVIIKMALKDLDGHVEWCDKRNISKHEWCVNSSMSRTHDAIHYAYRVDQLTPAERAAIPPDLIPSASAPHR